MEYYRLTIPVPKRPWQWIRFRLTTILLCVAIVAVALAWRRDHQQLAAVLHSYKNPVLYYGATQATGPPNVPQQGDSRNAWCPATINSGPEWLLLEFEKSVAPTAILVHESFAPGAVVRITHLPISGQEVTLWQGTYTPTPGTAGSVAKLPVSVGIKTNRIKVYLDTAAAPGWNEIDAVGMEYGNSDVIWASGAKASSTWNQPNGMIQTNLGSDTATWYYTSPTY
jgi:hypothetical protein